MEPESPVSKSAKPSNLIEDIKATTWAVPQGFLEGKSDNQLLSERMANAYEALA